jgi:hypothetical protein
LALGRLGLQPRLGGSQPRQPAAGTRELGWELIPSGRVVLAVLGLVDLGGLAQDLLDLRL